MCGERLERRPVLAALLSGEHAGHLHLGGEHGHGQLGTAAGSGASSTALRTLSCGASTCCGSLTVTRSTPSSPSRFSCWIVTAPVAASVRGRAFPPCGPCCARAEASSSASPRARHATLLETFDRLWTASELARRWSAYRNPGRDGVGEHRRLEEAALARDADTAAEVLAQHLTLTAAGLAGGAHHA
jgi:FCD domain-containing protein